MNIEIMDKIAYSVAEIMTQKRFESSSTIASTNSVTLEFYENYKKSLKCLQNISKEEKNNEINVELPSINLR